MQTVENFGWTHTLQPPHDYLAPVIRRIAHELGAHKVFDRGCGNGALASELAVTAIEGVGRLPLLWKSMVLVARKTGDRGTVKSSKFQLNLRPHI